MFAVQAACTQPLRLAAGDQRHGIAIAVEIEHLKLQIAKLRRMQFGRKSEKLDHQIQQLELELQEMQADEGEAAREMPAADQAPRKKSCLVSCDHIPRRSMALFRARAMLDELIGGLPPRSSHRLQHIA